MPATKHCLVVDDSEVIREIAMRIIADLGVDVAGAANASDGVAHCRETKTDVVFLDWDMPSMGALDFLRGAAEIEESHRPEIVLCATENDPQQFTLAKAAGARHHILKPFDKESLTTKLNEVGVIESDSAPSARPAANG